MQKMGVLSGFIVFLQWEGALGLKRGPNNGCMACLYNHIKSHMSNIEQWTQ